jgi:hypothetical protein
MSANALLKQAKGEAMGRKGDEVHLTETEATGAVKSKGVRTVLIVSLALIVVAMSAVLIFGAVLR